ncbi:hypothetical protein RRG08_067370 [Elysia crispata]|uniref:Uncharacterized protein n=1 Tax=Elysia crispata TaxID=231223 RepID=A0AAE0YAM6_9GAST|nr:hypothetical protein RRG08_067370 [Elysia crispata]
MFQQWPGKLGLIHACSPVTMVTSVIIDDEEYWGLAKGHGMTFSSNVCPSAAVVKGDGAVDGGKRRIRSSSSRSSGS